MQKCKRCDAFLRVVLLITTTMKRIESQSQSQDTYTFNRTSTCISFSPYVKNWETINIPGRNTYSVSDIKIMLRLVHSRFSKLATFGIGAEGQPPEGSVGVAPFAEARVSIAAAQLNRDEGANTTILQGIRTHLDNDDLLNREIVNSLSITMEADKIWAGTVTGFVLAANVDPTVLVTLRNASDTWPRGRLSLGMRSDNCTKDNEVHNFLNGTGTLDFVICKMFPPFPSIKTVEEGAVAVQSEFKRVEASLKATNPRLQVHLETGWPSMGPDDTLFNLANLKAYWEAIDSWASQTDTTVYLLEGIDQPWKSNPDIQDRNNPTGKYGLDGHFGWWKRTDTYGNNPNSYIEKIVEIPKVEEVPNSNLGLYLSIPIISSLIIGGLIGYLYRIKKIRDAQIEIKLTEEEIKEFEQGAPTTNANAGTAPSTGYVNAAENVEPLSLPYNKEYEIPKDDLQIMRSKVLGSGAYGIVYYGSVDKGQKEVAIKTIKKGSLAKELKNLLSEIKILTFIGKHENIVGLVGAQTADLREGIAFLAIEFCGSGSLEKYLRTHEYSDPSTTYANIGNGGGPSNEGYELYANEVLLQVDQHDVRYVNAPGSSNTLNQTKHVITMENILNWAYQIANGMEHLAGKNIVHADLAARNILLTQDGTAKITDFGLSRRLYEYTQYVKQNQEPLPWRWMSPESLRNMTFSTQSDVWSYGVTLWEIFSLGGIPYPGLSWDVQFLQELDNGLRMTKPRLAPDDVYDAMIQTWHDSPSSRPNFSTLKRFFMERTQ